MGLTRLGAHLRDVFMKRIISTAIVGLTLIIIGRALEDDASASTPKSEIISEAMEGVFVNLSAEHRFIKACSAFAQSAEPEITADLSMLACNCQYEKIEDEFDTAQMNVVIGFWGLLRDNLKNPDVGPQTDEEIKQALGSPDDFDLIIETLSGASKACSPS